MTVHLEVEVSNYFRILVRKEMYLQKMEQQLMEGKYEETFVEQERKI